MGQKSKLTTEQRMQLVLRLLSKEEPGAQIARRAGVSEQTLHRWRDEFVNSGKRGLNARGTQAEQAKTLERLQGQLAERDQVIGELTIANRVLKNSRASRADRGAAHDGHERLCGGPASGPFEPGAGSVGGSALELVPAPLR